MLPQITARQMAIFKSFIPSLMTFGGAAGVGLLFLGSDWKAKDVLQYLPVYNRKYEPKDKDM